MRWNTLKRQAWNAIVLFHSDVRVAALLRAISVIGIVGGFGAFLIGLNPLVAQWYGPSGDSLLHVGIAGLFVHILSVAYYYATAPTMFEEGLLK